MTSDCEHKRAEIGEMKPSEMAPVGIVLTLTSTSVVAFLKTVVEVQQKYIAQ